MMNCVRHKFIFSLSVAEASYVMPHKMHLPAEGIISGESRFKFGGGGISWSRGALRAKEILTLKLFSFGN